MKKNLMISLALITSVTLIMQSVIAQSWNITGNNNTTALSKLGTTNFIPLSLYTDNAERIRIDEIGRVGIGISAPVNVLTVKSTAGLPVATWTNGLTSPVFVGFADNASSESVLAAASNISVRRPVMQGRRARGTLAAPAAVVNNDYLSSFLASGFDGNTFQNPATIDFFVDGVPSAGNVPARISFVTGSNQANRTERLKVGSTGDFNFNNNQLVIDASLARVGIGTFFPERKLHVFNGSAGGVLSNANSPLVVENNTSNFISVLAPAGSERGILFGDNVDAQDGGIIYNGGANSLQFRTNGNATRMTLSSTGNLDIAGGTLSFGSVEAFADAGAFTISCNSDFVTDVDGTNSLGTASNTWFDVWATDPTINTSDARLKENVNNLSYGLDEILKLRPVTYTWIKHKEQGKRIGLIAQEVQKIIPEMVKDSRIVKDEATGAFTKVPTSKLGITYDALIPVLVKAIQEQDAKMKAYETKIDELTKMVLELAKNNGSLPVRPVAAFLSQNSPNPPVANSTRIGYSLPEGVNKAELVIHDVAGRKLKQIPLNNSGDGYVNLNTSLMSKGTYTYSLIVNGVLADTKKMVLSGK